MATPVKDVPHGEKVTTGAAMARLHRQKGGREAHQLVELARRYTQAAIRKIALLMEGKAGTIKTLDKNGVLVEIDIEVPAAVQLKAAEVLLERGHGKAPMAILLKGDGLLPVDKTTLTVAEKIVALSQAQAEQGETRDLEASECKEVLELMPPEAEERQPVAAEDMI